MCVLVQLESTREKLFFLEVCVCEREMRILLRNCRMSSPLFLVRKELECGDPRKEDKAKQRGSFM
jgi:hypothetical protein